MSKQVAPVNFRPTDESRSVLDDAKKVAEITEFLNGLVAKYGPSYVSEIAKKKMSDIQHLLATR